MLCLGDLATDDLLALGVSVPEGTREFPYQFDRTGLGTSVLKCIRFSVLTVLDLQFLSGQLHVKSLTEADSLPFSDSICLDSAIVTLPHARKIQPEDPLLVSPVALEAFLDRLNVLTNRELLADVGRSISDGRFNSVLEDRGGVGLNAKERALLDRLLNPTEDQPREVGLIKKIIAQSITSCLRA